MGAGDDVEGVPLCKIMIEIQVRYVCCLQVGLRSKLFPLFYSSRCVTVPTVTLTREVGPGLQDLQTRARRILAERNAEKAEENTWIGRMVAAESIGELDGLIKSRAA